ncbi:GNAT family N-acetyltransferase [Sphingobacterium siyangense]|uniref:GNAT family N-acetyltransferase n=1 Tax=Sphingobacterium siyangense TaxID=459529 RepID=UPI003DA38F7B
MEIIVAKNREQIVFCKDVLFAFRSNLEEATYVDLIMNMIANESFQLAYIASDDKTKAVAFVGYRIMHMLRTSWQVYIDDLYTDPGNRGKGYAGALLDFVDNFAKNRKIDFVHLDSGYMLNDAHRLYLNKGFVLACNHFAKNLPA